MDMSISLPSAWDEFRTAADSMTDTRHEQCWDVVGEPLNKPVREVVPAYYEKLELGDKKIAMTKRGEILDLYWGRIEQDGAALVGLGKALTNLSATIEANVRAVAAQWSGESYDAFATAMGKVRTTLDAYSAAATKVGGVVLEAMTQARSMYQDYATASQESLNFDRHSPPEQWRKMSEKTATSLALKCPTAPLMCEKADGQAVALIVGQFASDRQLKICEADPCDQNLERVLIMFGHMVKAGKEGRDKIREQVQNWCDATDDFKDQITGLVKIATDNVYKLGQAQTFSNLRVVGGAAGGGQPVSDQGDVGTGGGYPDTGAAVEPLAEPAVTPEPESVPVEQPVPETAVVEPAAEATEPEVTEPAEEPATDPTTVTITDGDRTIGVSNAGGGHVTVTVTDASGVTKTYDLDFDAASGLPQATGTPPVEGVEQVPASTNGKCVITDGAATITAERPLFAPDQVALTVDDGSGTSNTYTVDLPDIEAAEAGSTETTPDSTATTLEPAATPEAEVAPTADPRSGQPGYLTSPQAFVEDARGSVSGVLVPDQPGGEAGLAVAPDAAQPQSPHDATGMVGAGLPMMGGASGSNEGARTGSGWSVHGDLFDSGEPVYSMHGVLGDDDTERTDR